MHGDPIDSQGAVAATEDVETATCRDDVETATGRGVEGVPTTGDAAIDETLVELLQAQSGSLAERIDAGERAHRLLQGRLSDLGGA
jgi:hypothetical protein